MKQTINKLIVSTLVITVALLFLTGVAWARWSAGAGWQFLPSRSDPDQDDLNRICTDGIIFGLADSVDRGPYTVEFYKEGEGPPGDAMIGSKADFALEEPNYPTEHSFCYISFSTDTATPEFCGGPYFVPWNEDANTDIDVWLSNDSAVELLSGDPIFDGGNFKVGDCTVLPINLVQTEPGTTDTVVSDILVFQVETYLGVGNSDGGGLNHVDMSIIDPNGLEVYKKLEEGAQYCAFGGNGPCNVWNFANHNYEWQNGSLIKNGNHTLRAIAYPDNGGSKTKDFLIQIELPIAGNWVQIGQNSTTNTVTDALVGQVEAYVGAHVDGKDVARVEITLKGPDGQNIRVRTENGQPYCLFGGNNPCPVWNFADNNYQWPNGDYIQDGTHTLQAIIYANDPGTPDNRGQSIEAFEFDLQMPPIVTQLAQTGPGTTASIVTDALVFQLEAFIGGSNTDGTNIDNVDMRIIDPDGNEVHQRTENNPKYCVFGGGEPDCNEWVFADHDYKWPGGTSIKHGQHTLRATVNTKDGRSETVEFVIDLQMPPIVTNLAQTGPGTTNSLITDTLVFQAEAYIGASHVDGTNIDNVDMRIIDPNGNEVHQFTDNSVKYCAFGGGQPNCNQWVFADHDYKWPGGDRIKNGNHKLQITVNTKDGRSETVEFTIQIDKPTIEDETIPLFLPLIVK